MNYVDGEPIVYVGDDGQKHPAKVMWWLYPLEAEVCELEWTEGGEARRETCGSAPRPGSVLGPRVDGRSVHWVAP